MKTILIEVNVDSDKDIEEIYKAIQKGIYWGLDIKKIAEPKKVKIGRKKLKTVKH